MGCLFFKNLTGVYMMNDILAGKWKQLTGEIKKQWGKLTDDDLTMIAGQKDKLLGKLEERYGYAKTKAQEELDVFLSKNNCDIKDDSAK
jgi:uncharacterized protein YjbJ (UPF0337 family)